MPVRLKCGQDSEVEERWKGQVLQADPFVPLGGSGSLWGIYFSVLSSVSSLPRSLSLPPPPPLLNPPSCTASFFQHLFYKKPKGTRGL